ncbi:DUF1264 domain protein [Talaromyces stipitatus ATCC 10500]|uniref:DUF1264 domain protein n=1 Tax=Talaromyces stipitatus (strain ATCC 10500 / CBS 375.48 / QM 6759 / NRRL 1006) TaxID=441959 RepID=B8LSS6_TALSN|nr:DUF1264 domain protein [Talaromyces stipitatus ATCC 10500]EED22922.1 DUF1264 domain protein [Talaromyces stipitatus ATCC 10500]
MVNNDNAAGDDLTTKSRVLETAAGVIQDFRPVKSICAHLNAFHVYASDPTRAVEANHYCAHITEDIRQCLLYDSPEPNARLIGIEYMITPKIYSTLDPSERELWHSHIYEVKSGMLIMPTPAGVPNSVWQMAETSEMKDIIPLYGKAYHLWQVDRGDKVPLGKPELMGSFGDDAMLEKVHPEGKKGLLRDRDRRFRADYEENARLREGLEEPELHPDADAMMRKKVE